MREILFRGKRIDNGEWVYGCLLKVTLNGKTAHLIFGDNFRFDGNDVKALSHALVDPTTVGWYTGLTDKNGKRIFEGDIVEDASVGLLGDVVFSVVGVPSFGINDVHDGLQYHDGFWSDLEVIGNIHDNPELLEGGTDNGNKENLRPMRRRD